MKKTAQMICYAMLLYLGASFLIQFLIVFVVEMIAMVYVIMTDGAMESVIELTTNGWFLLITSVISSNIIGPLSAWLLIRKLPNAGFDKNRLTTGNVLMSGCVCLGTLYLFGYLSEGILWGVSKLTNTTVEQLNAVNQMSEQFNNWQYILLVCVIAPIIEEVFFRGLVIKKMLVHGKVAALVLSAAVFGLVHGTLSQIPYALALGFVLGYVYIKYGNIYLNIGLHMVMNFMGGVLFLIIEDFPYIDYLYLGVSIGLILSAIVIVVLKRKDIKNYILADDNQDMPAGQQIKTVLLNPGFILFAVACLLLMLVSLGSSILLANMM